MTFTKSDLKNLREALLDLHKALLHFQKRQLEKKQGKFASRGNLLDATLGHPDFAWLRQLSSVIVAMDEMLEEKKDFLHMQNKAMVLYVVKLLKAAPPRNKFSENYYSAIQKEPNIAIAHSRVRAILKKISGK